MAAVAGYGGQVRVGAAVAANITAWSCDLDMDNDETTPLGAASGAKTYIMLTYGGSGSIDANFDMADTNGQLALQNAFFNRATVALSLDTAASGTNRTYSGNAYITKISPSVDVGKKTEISFDFTFNGPVTFA